MAKARSFDSCWAAAAAWCRPHRAANPHCGMLEFRQLARGARASTHHGTFHNQQPIPQPFPELCPYKHPSLKPNPCTPQVARAALLLLPMCDVDPPTEALDALHEAEYATLRPRHKLALLRALSDAWLSSPSGQQVLQAGAWPRWHGFAGAAISASHLPPVSPWRLEHPSMARRCDVDARAESHKEVAVDTRHEARASERAARWRSASLRAASEHQLDPRIHVINPHHTVADPTPTPAPQTPPADDPAGASGEASTGIATTPRLGAGVVPASPPSMPCPNATLILLEAIASAEETRLQAAIRLANPTHSGTLDPVTVWRGGAIRCALPLLPLLHACSMTDSLCSVVPFPKLRLTSSSRVFTGRSMRPHE